MEDITVCGIVVERSRIAAYLTGKKLPAKGPRISRMVATNIDSPYWCKNFLATVADDPLLARPRSKLSATAYAELVWLQFLELPVPDKLRHIGEVEMAKAKKTNKSRKDSTPARAKHGRGSGVISTILQTMARDKGATKEEIVAALTKKFPERDAESMATTVGIQTSQLAKRDGVKIDKEKDEKRGLVYRAKLSAALQKQLAA